MLRPDIHTALHHGEPKPKPDTSTKTALRFLFNHPLATAKSSMTSIIHIPAIAASLPTEHRLGLPSPATKAVWILIPELVHSQTSTTVLLT